MLGVAIIGCGNISKTHIEGYMEFSNLCEIKAFVDIYPEKAEKKKNEFNLEAQVFDDHKDRLGREDIDLISICTPPYTHIPSRYSKPLISGAFLIL